MSNMVVSFAIMCTAIIIILLLPPRSKKVEKSPIEKTADYILKRTPLFVQCYVCPCCKHIHKGDDGHCRYLPSCTDKFYSRLLHFCSEVRHLEEK